MSELDRWAFRVLASLALAFTGATIAAFLILGHG